MVPRSVFLASVVLFQLSCQTAVGIPLSEFYPFGEEAGDISLPRTLDGSSPLIKLASAVFPFYGQEYDQLFVSICSSMTLCIKHVQSYSSFYSYSI